VTIKNSPMWVQNYMACDDLNIHNITVHSTVNHNNDGIDIDGCHNVRISDCNIRSGDDAIVLKSLSPRMCKNVTITNCVLSSICNAFKLGTESTGGFKNIVVNNCTMYDTRLSGIALEIVDGGTMDQVLISNIVMRNVKGGIFVRLGDRARPYLSRKSTVQHLPEYEMEEKYAHPEPGVVKNIMIKNIIATGIGNVGCSVVGLPEHKIENIKLKDLSIQYDGGGKKDWVTREVPENREDYPEFNMFGPLPAYGFYCRHVQNLELSDLSLSYKKDEPRPALYLENVENYDMNDLKLSEPQSEYERIIIKATQK
ncbi:MAG: glycosyl hydrolase family 28 protein, partial [Bacteroidales bacterium]